VPHFPPSADTSSLNADELESMMKKKLLIALAAGTGLAGLAVGTAWAQDAASPRGDRPAMTRDAAQERAGTMFARLDANSDGVLNEADREARQRQMFARMDTNGDDMIEFSEFTAMREKVGEMRAERVGERRGRRGHGDRRMGGRGMGERMMANADSDGDGAVSQAEFSTALLARFDAADTNGDGEISGDERSGPGKWRNGSRAGEGS